MRSSWSKCGSIFHRCDGTWRFHQNHQEEKFVFGRRIASSSARTTSRNVSKEDAVASEPKTSDSASTTGEAERAFTNEARTKDLLRQVEGWKEGLPLLEGVMDIRDYNPGNRNRQTKHYGPLKARMTPIVVTLPANKRKHELILSTEGQFLTCAWNDDEIYFVKIAERELVGLMAEEIYSTVIGIFTAERDRTVEEFQRKAEQLRSLESWHLPFTPEAWKAVMEEGREAARETRERLDRMRPTGRGSGFVIR
jgi:hypothetical protein